MATKKKDQGLERLKMQLLTLQMRYTALSVQLLQKQAEIANYKPNKAGEADEAIKALAKKILSVWKQLPGKSSAVSPYCVSTAEVAERVNKSYYPGRTSPDLRSYAKACTVAFGESFTMKRSGKVIRGYRVIPIVASVGK